MPKWRNWQTRYVQGVVSLGLMRVQLPPSALYPRIRSGGHALTMTITDDGTILVTTEVIT